MKIFGMLCVWLLFAASGTLLAESSVARIFLPVKFEAEVPSWQDFSDLRFFVASGDKEKITVAIVASGTMLYNVVLTLTLDGKPVSGSEILIGTVDRFSMATIDVSASVTSDQLPKLRITQFSAATK